MIHNLQLLRAVAAYMVFLHHFSIYLRPAVADANLIGLGAAGVDIFFVISGFIMVATTMERSTTPGDFLLRRVARVFPVYWVVTLLVVLLVLVGFRPIGVLELQPGYVIQSLLFLPFLRGEYLEPLLSVGWTLNYEMFFYVIFAALLTVRSERLRLACLVLVLVGLGLSSLAEPAGFYLRFYTRPIIIDFAFGALLGYAYLRTRHRPAGPRSRLLGYGLLAAAGLLLAASEVVAHRSGVATQSLPFSRLLFWGTAGLLMVAGALILERSGQVCRAPVLVEQGNASYSIYLIHNLVLHAASKVAALVAPGSVASIGLIFVLALGTTAILGVLLYRWVELPLNHGLRAAFRTIGGGSGPGEAATPSAPAPSLRS